VSEAIHIEPIGVVCTRGRPEDRYLGLIPVDGSSMVFAVEVDEDGHVGLNIEWRGVIVYGFGESLADAFADAEERAMQLVPRIYREFAVLRYARVQALRKETKTVEDEEAVY
jgi:hypothetical protein